jgi:hypothetical protein
MSTGGGKSHGSSSSIYISSTESAKQKVGTLVIGKNDLIIDKDGIVNLAITTTDISTPENADKVINLTTNRGEADFLITGGEDENKFRFLLSKINLIYKTTNICSICNADLSFSRNKCHNNPD